MNIKVSIIIPIYNTERYLDECLHSVENQILKEFECICIDDGSVDGSYAIAKKYEDKDARFKVYSKKNGGASSARNFGLSKAMGEYIYFLDSDDSITEDAMEYLYSKAQRDDLDVLLFDGLTVFSTAELQFIHSGFEDAYIRKGTYTGISSGRDLLINLVNNRDYIVSPCLQFVRRVHILEHRNWFFEGIIYEDNLFTLKNIISAKRIGHLKMQLFKRRVRENSVMTNTQIAFFQFYSGFKCYIEELKFTINICDDELKNACAKILSGLWSQLDRQYNKISKQNLREQDVKLLLSLDAMELTIMKHLGFQFQLFCIFPYQLIDRGSDIVLYGAGNVGQRYYNQIQFNEYCNICLWVDRNANNISKKNNLPVVLPEMIKTINYNSILIAVEEEDLANSIKNYLLKEGIAENKIVWEKPIYMGI